MMQEEIVVPLSGEEVVLSAACRNVSMHNSALCLTKCQL